jgi:GMP synthase-like glutamine amidotransferase
VTTVGVLLCDHVSERNRSIAGDYGDMFAALFAAHAPALEVVPVAVVDGELPGAVDDCDAWLCTGSRHSVYDPEQAHWIDPLADFLRRVRRSGAPFAGICFGHQLLAHALGGTVARATTGWGAGVRDIVVERPRPWMAPPVSRLALQFMHQDQVVALPPGGVVLGRAAHCPVAMLQAGPAMIGVQAHPEFVPAYVEVLLAAREDVIGPAEVAVARASLACPTDEAVVTGWLARVLVGGPVAG